MYSRITDFIRDRFSAAPGASVPLHAPLFAGNEKKYLEECIDTTFVSSVGAFVDRFERDMEAYTGARRAVVCVSGTAALHIALLMAGTEPGDLVLTQSLSFIATCNAISYTGARPVFIDVDRDTMGLSPAALEAWLEENSYMDDDGVCRHRPDGRRIRACVPMHTFGHPVRITEIAGICSRHCIALVEDAAESIGSSFRGRHTGTFGLVGAISFNGNKTITTGGGGMLLFNDEELGARAKHITTQAKVPHRWEFVHDSVGYNYRMPNINAALGCAQLENIERFIASKRATALAYRDFFAALPEGSPKFVEEPAESRSNYWLNAVLLPSREQRDAFLEFTNSHGVMTRPVWELMTRLPMFAADLRDSQVNSEWLADRVVNIPSSVIL